MPKNKNGITTGNIPQTKTAPNYLPSWTRSMGRRGNQAKAKLPTASWRRSAPAQKYERKGTQNNNKVPDWAEGVEGRTEEKVPGAKW